MSDDSDSDETGDRPTVIRIERPNAPVLQIDVWPDGRLGITWPETGAEIVEQLDD